jgi:nitrogen fixation protein FixH
MTFRISWAWMPVALLGSLSAGLGVMISIAVNDPSFAVEPAYYQHALNWDARRAEEEQSRALGWAVDWQILPSGTSNSTQIALLRLRAQDVSNAPISGATAHISAFHNARAAHVQELNLREESPGIYSAPLAVLRPGIWQLRLQANRGSERFLQTLSVEFARNGQVLMTQVKSL